MRRLQPIATSAQTKAIAIAVSLLVHALVVLMVTNISIPKVELPTRTKFIAVSLSPGETIETQLPVPALEVENTPEVTTPVAPAPLPAEPDTSTKPSAAKQPAASTQPRVNPQPSPEVPKAKQSTPLTPTLAQPPSTNTPASPAAPATPVEPTKAPTNNNLAAEFAKEANSLKEAAEADAQQKRSAEQTAKALKEEVKQQAAERRKLGDKTAKQIGYKVYENWVVPNTAAEHYKPLKVRITLSPTGEVKSITPLERYGKNAVYDSLEAAILDAAPFAMPDDIEVYNKYLRSIPFTMDPRQAGR